MFLWEGGWWRETEDLDELVLEDGEIRVAFLEGVGAEGETDGNMIACMGFGLRGLCVRKRLLEGYGRCCRDRDLEIVGLGRGSTAV